MSDTATVSSRVGVEDYAKAFFRTYPKRSFYLDAWPDRRRGYLFMRNPGEEGFHIHLLPKLDADRLMEFRDRDDKLSAYWSLWHGE